MEQVGEVLAAHGVPDLVSRAEVAHLQQWRIAPTGSPPRRRHHERVRLLHRHLARAAARPDLVDLAVRLAATPCSPLYQRHVSPDRELAAIVRQFDA
ncbi:hypothetical protein [Micromonospora alfalfae]|uniref:hypothetical protein n=1 Tax=Micromonospora alfalfae TaxID=2911212 RepID=UPI001EE82CC8|nr:hypothetical protein [Micromonospora alfalfae]